MNNLDIAYPTENIFTVNGIGRSINLENNQEMEIDESINYKIEFLKKNITNICLTCK